MCKKYDIHTYIYTGTPFSLRSSQRSIRVARRGHDIDYSNKCFPSSFEVDTRPDNGCIAICNCFNVEIESLKTIFNGSSLQHTHLPFPFVNVKNVAQWNRMNGQRAPLKAAQRKEFVAEAGAANAACGCCQTNTNTQIQIQIQIHTRCI